MPCSPNNDLAFSCHFLAHAFAAMMKHPSLWQLSMEAGEITPLKRYACLLMLRLISLREIPTGGQLWAALSGKKSPT
jgi:hypothetical protein